MAREEIFSKDGPLDNWKSINSCENMHDLAVIIEKHNTLKRNTQTFVFMIRFYLVLAIHDCDKVVKGLIQ